MSCARLTNKEFFDSLAPDWDNIAEVNPLRINHILDVAGIAEGHSVLDVGTGTGVLLPYLLERTGSAGHIDAADISDKMLDVARSKYPDATNIDFLNIDIETDTAPGTYDCITMYCMYPHLENPYDTLKWLYNVSLKPGGCMIIAFPESKDSINSLHRHNDGSVHSDKLMDGERFAGILREMGLNADYVEDTPDYYIIRLTRPADA